MTFSLHDRDKMLLHLRTEIFDLLVVGGGITGAGIARDAALRGLKVALIERDDFAAGTSSRSSKLIHGGLRYLEMGDVALVFEAVRERQRLLQLAPHLARAQSFVLPVFEHSKHSIFVLDVGLTVYDLLASFAGVMHHRAVRKKALLHMEPLLREQGLNGGVRYFDAMTDDARLVMANIRGAVQAGATAVSRVRFVEPIFKGPRLVSARVHDDFTGESLLIACKCVVSAAGPWTDEFIGRWKNEPTAKSLRPSKGVHVVLPRKRLPLSQAVMMTAKDGRVVFALPWSHATVLGTTDTLYSGDLAEPPCTHADAQYLIDTANSHFGLGENVLQISDIISTWAGIRPLVASETAHPPPKGKGNKKAKPNGDQASYNASREHAIISDPRGLVAIFGGKLTTYRVMAEQAVDAAIKLLPQTPIVELKNCVTTELPLPGAEHLQSPKQGKTKTPPLAALTSYLADTQHISQEIALHLSQQYGSEAEQVLQTCHAQERGMTQIFPDLPILWGELRWLCEQEMVLSLLDLTVRRSQLYYLAGERLLALADELAQRMAECLGLPASSHARYAQELRDFIAARRVGPAENADAA